MPFAVACTSTPWKPGRSARGAGCSRTSPAATSTTTLANATTARVQANGEASRSGISPARTHSPAASPSRMFAFISAASRFQGTSGIADNSGRIPRTAPKAAISPRQSSHFARWRLVRQRANGPRSSPVCNANVARFGCFIFLPLSIFHIPAELDAGIRNVRPHRGLGAIQPLGHFFRRQAFYIAQHKRGPFPGSEKAQTVFQVIPLLGPKQDLLGTFRAAYRRFFDFAKRDAAAAAQEIDRRIGGDPRQPMRGLLLVLDLVLALQRLDKCLLGQILGIRDIPDDPVDLNEDAP